MFSFMNFAVLLGINPLQILIFAQKQEVDTPGNSEKKKRLDLFLCLFIGKSSKTTFFEQNVQSFDGKLKKTKRFECLGQRVKEEGLVEDDRRSRRSDEDGSDQNREKRL